MSAVSVSLAYRSALRDAQAMASRGMSAGAVLAGLRVENGAGRYEPALTDGELVAAADEAVRPRVVRAIAVKDGRVAPEDAPCKLSVYTSTPPVWTLHWGLGQTVRVSSAELPHWPKVAVAYLDQNYQEVRWKPSREKWDEVRRDLMDRLDVEDAGEELTLRGAVLDFLRTLVARASHDPERLQAGSVYFDEAAGLYVIVAAWLVNAIDNGPAGSTYRFRQGFTARTVTGLMKSSLGAERAVMRIGGRPTRVWKIPAAPLDEAR